MKHRNPFLKKRIPKSEVLQAIRKQGIGRIEEVGAVVLKKTGTISVLLKQKSEDEKLDRLGNST